MKEGYKPIVGKELRQLGSAQTWFFAYVAKPATWSPFPNRNPSCNLASAESEVRILSAFIGGTQTPFLGLS